MQSFPLLSVSKTTSYCLFTLDCSEFNPFNSLGDKLEHSAKETFDLLLLGMEIERLKILILSDFLNSCLDSSSADCAFGRLVNLLYFYFVALNLEVSNVPF